MKNFIIIIVFCGLISCGNKLTKTDIIKENVSFKEELITNQEIQSLIEFKEHFIKCVRNVLSSEYKDWDKISWDVCIPAYYPSWDELKATKDTEKMKSILDYCKFNKMGTLIIGYIEGKPIVGFEIWKEIDPKVQPGNEKCPYQFMILGDSKLSLVSQGLKEIKEEAKNNQIVRIIVDGYYSFCYIQNNMLNVYRIKRYGLRVSSEEEITEIARERLIIMKEHPDDIVVF